MYNIHELLLFHLYSNIANGILSELQTVGKKKEPNSVHMIDARVPKLSDQLHSLFFI